MRGTNTPQLRTERLLLRRWRDSDRAPFAAINADPEVVACLPGALTREESDAFVDRIEERFAEQGFGMWAVEVADGEPFIGYVGLNVPRIEAPFMPAVEIGWRLARSSWGYGYATEAAREVLRFAFEETRLDEVVSFTVPANERSQAVMRRLGMTRDPADDFDHPGLPEGHPLRRHVLYRIASTSGPTTAWAATAGTTTSTRPSCE